MPKPYDGVVFDCDATLSASKALTNWPHSPALPHKSARLPTAR